jgi:hypothetical protein
MAGSTVDMNVQDKLRGIASRNYEEEEKGKKSTSKHSHGATHHKTRKNKTDHDARVAAEKKRKEEESKKKEGTPEDIGNMSKEQLANFQVAIRNAGKGNPVEFLGKVYTLNPGIGRAIEQREEELHKGGGSGGSQKYTVAYDKWVRKTFQPIIAKGTDVNVLLADGKIQTAFKNTSGQSPLAT